MKCLKFFWGGFLESKKKKFLPADNRDDQVYETNEEDETMNSPFDQSVNLSPEIDNGDSPSALKSPMLSPITIVIVRNKKKKIQIFQSLSFSKDKLQHDLFFTKSILMIVWSTS